MERMSEKLNEVIKKSWDHYNSLFDLTMSEKTLIQHFCEYMSKVGEYDE